MHARSGFALCEIYRTLSSRPVLLVRLRLPLDLFYIGNPEITVMKVPVKIRFSGRRITYFFLLFNIHRGDGVLSGAAGTGVLLPRGLLWSVSQLTQGCFVCYPRACLVVCSACCFKVVRCDVDVCGDKSCFVFFV